MIVRGATLLCLLVVSSTVRADEISDFTSDGCSAFPDGTREQEDLWHSCCVAHDLAYWKGGTSDERKEADLTLAACVEAVGEPKIAKLMLAGVRVGGTPWLPTRFRWAYGWPYLRGYKEIDAAEERQVEAKMEAALALIEEQEGAAAVDSK